MTGSFQIVDASWRDFNELRQLENECFPLDAWPFWDVLGILTLPDVVRLKAVTHGKMTGFIAGDVRRHEGAGWIATLAVTEGYRRNGIAIALITTLEIQMNVKKVKLCVRRSNTAAINLYHKLGYQDKGVWEKYYVGNEDALVLEKVLEGV
ncbi:MAG: GNAT family N-acetyltransferase [Anaerolineaceae bacterium]|nr:GNAT family N-acetyltransferase [Anaerolineaceae bacterium]MBN2678395.1 GNAT family N-acetyltransferase [Anaerolineaceae bacterium]